MRHFYLFLLIFITGVSAFSQSENIITSVRVTGLTRTRQNTAEKPLRRFIGMDAGELDTDQVIAAVMEQGILEPVSVSLEDSAQETGKVLVVEVREKWSLFPMPVFSAGSGGTSGGLFIYNANTFGLNHMLVLGGMLGEDSWMAMGMYMVPPGGRYNLGWSVSGMFSDGERRNSDEEDNTLRLYKSRIINTSASLQHNFNNAFSASLRISYTDITLLDFADSIREPEAGMKMIQPRLGLTARRSSWDGVFLSEESASVRYGTIIIDFDSNIYHSVSFRGTYQKPIIPGFRISSRSAGIYMPDAPPLLENGQGDSAVNIYPGDFSARHYAGLSLGLEKSLFQFTFGTVSALGAWQMAYSNGPILGDRFDYGGAFSLHFYMSRLAIPAIGFGAAYNIPADYFQFSFIMGMSF